MGDFVAIFIVGFVVLGIYRLFELFARRKERMAIIERLGDQIKLSEANVDLNLPIFKESRSNWALKISLLLIGIGIGLVVAYWIEFKTVGVNWNSSTPSYYYKNKMEVVYFASVAIFGGIGLLSAYFIERKHKIKE
jgi:hypothetical protein